jgi:cell division septation protein DedD
VSLAASGDATPAAAAAAADQLLQIPPRDASYGQRASFSLTGLPLQQTAASPITQPPGISLNSAAALDAKERKLDEYSANVYRATQHSMEAGLQIISIKGAPETRGAAKSNANLSRKAPTRFNPVDAQVEALRLNTELKAELVVLRLEKSANHSHAERDLVATVRLDPSSGTLIDICRVMGECPPT